MNKKDLEQKLIDVNAQLKALGDLGALIQQSQALPGVLSDAQAKRQSLDTLLQTMSVQQGQFKKLVSEAEVLRASLAENNENVSGLVAQITSLEEKVKELVEETRVQLGKAANEKLANSFEQVKEKLIDERDTWFMWLVGAVVALVVATVGIVSWQIFYEKAALFEIGFLIKIALTSPLVYFVVFVNREYARARSLIEEYAFKAAIARSFEAYNDIIEQAFEAQQAQVYQQKLNFILNAITGLYSSPMRNIKENHLAEKENTPDIFSKAHEAVSRVVKPPTQ